MLKEIKKGFTLAEVLIVIGIIGVVAALTLPNLNHATGDKEKVTKVKKIYSTLTEAFDRAQAIYGDFDTWFKDLDCSNNRSSCSERFAKRVTEFMKVSKDCGFESGCWAEADLIQSNGESFGDPGYSGYTVMLPDGCALLFIGSSKINVDIDGPNKGKKQLGTDIFDFSINYDIDPINQIIPSASIASWTENLSETYSGNYATAWVIENGNLDYLKVDEDGNCPDGQPLNWETKTSCE